MKERRTEQESKELPKSNVKSASWLRRMRDSISMALSASTKGARYKSLKECRTTV
jgi:hypothetical protein